MIPESELESATADLSPDPGSLTALQTNVVWTAIRRRPG